MEWTREMERTRKLAAAGVTAEMALQQVTDEFTEAVRQARLTREFEQEERVKQMERNANHGDLHAMFTLINWHRCGEMGLKQDEVQPWIDLAIRRGCEVVSSPPLPDVWNRSRHDLASVITTVWLMGLGPSSDLTARPSRKASRLSWYWLRV